MIKKNKELETFDIKERVIFSAGTHNGDMYTEADIAEIARAFEECKGLLRPPLKLGHSEDQGMWEMEGLPAIGWIDNVKKVGSDLVADFIKVPKVIYELIAAGAFNIGLTSQTIQTPGYSTSTFVIQMVAGDYLDLSASQYVFAFAVSTHTAAQSFCYQEYTLEKDR